MACSTRSPVNRGARIEGVKTWTSRAPALESTFYPMTPQLQAFMDWLRDEAASPQAPS